MIQPQSHLKVIDNSGAKEIMCLSIPGVSKKKYASAGDIISAVVKKAVPRGTVNKGQIVRAIVVRTKKERRRFDGSYIRFDDNAAVLIDKEEKPLGTRIIGPIAWEVKNKGYSRVVSMAKEIF